MSIHDRIEKKALAIYEERDAAVLMSPVDEDAERMEEKKKLQGEYLMQEKLANQELRKEMEELRRRYMQVGLGLRL